ncbi:MAG: nuclear transport factor 2 family protein [Planctomycetota bacterium]
MSITESVHQLIETMKAGDILGAFETHYADDVVMQENNEAPTEGKAANREREKQFVASVKDFKSLWIDNVAVDESAGGNDGTAFIEYGFNFINTEGQDITYQQAARQTWKNGKIVSERFYHG